MFDMNLPPVLGDRELEGLTAVESAAWPALGGCGLPDDLESIPPGPFLVAVLSAVDRAGLSGFDTVRVLKARNRQVAHDQAELAADMVEVSHRCDAELGRTEEAWDYASDEIRAALTLTRRAAESELGFATDLWERFPLVFEALHAGRIDVRKARVIIGGVGHLDAGTARQVVDEALDGAVGLTTGQLRARIQRLCFESDPEEAAKRYDQRLAERRLESRSNPEGTANLHGLDLAPHEVAAIRGRVEVLARRLKQAGESRTMDQLRADVFVDLLLARRSGGSSKGGVITMTAPMESLAGLVEQAADVPGLGPMIADVARQVLADHPEAELRYRVTTSHGEVLIGTPSRRVTRALRRFLETRDPTCVGPGCRHPATECDIDHRQRWVDGGPTNDRNNQPLCRHDHILKDAGGWKLRKLPNNTYQWTSPLGHTYITNGQSP